MTSRSIEIEELKNEQTENYEQIKELNEQLDKLLYETKTKDSGSTEKKETESEVKTKENETEKSESEIDGALQNGEGVKIEKQSDENLQAIASCSMDPPGQLSPRIHFTPDCFRTKGPHDIAATLYHAPTKMWHVMAGCWSCGGWQHLVSSDLIHWEQIGTPQGFGGTGGMVHDEDGNIVAYAMEEGEIKFWVATDDTAAKWTLTNTSVKACCNDPIVWKDGNMWYLSTYVKNCIPFFVNLVVVLLSVS